MTSQSLVKVSSVGSIGSGIPIVVAFGGGAACGKTTIARMIADHLGPQLPAAWLNTDALRKELAGVPWSTRLDSSHYTREARNRIYQMLIQRGIASLSTGRSIILDASFGSSADRHLAEAIGEENSAPFCGLFFEAPVEIRIKRAMSRLVGPSDADARFIATMEQFEVPTIRDPQWRSIDASGSVAQAFDVAFDELQRFLRDAK